MLLHVAWCRGTLEDERCAQHVLEVGVRAGARVVVLEEQCVALEDEGAALLQALVRPRRSGLTA